MRYGWSHAPQYQIISQNRHNYPTLLDKVIQLNPIGRYLFVKLTTRCIGFLFYVVNDCRPGTASIIRFLLRHNRQNPGLVLSNRPACETSGLNEEILCLFVFITMTRVARLRLRFACLCPLGRRNLFMSY